MAKKKPPLPKCKKRGWNSLDCYSCPSIFKSEHTCAIFPLLPLIESAPEEIPKEAFEIKIPYFRIGRMWYFVSAAGEEFKVTPIRPEEKGAIQIRLEKAGRWFKDN